jgi:hypothetical protein
MDEVSIRIENLPEGTDMISLHENPEFLPLRYHGSNSPLTISENGSDNDSSNSDHEYQMIRENRIRNQIDSQFKKKRFVEIENSLSKYYDSENKYYDKIDILITFMKGQKTLFMQANFITQKKMYCFMLPVLFISAAMAIFAPIVQQYSWSGGVISGLNVLVTFFVSMIKYMKYESRADNYMLLANQYDRLEMSLEMTSNKVIYIEDEKEKNDIVLEKLNEIEISINELKELYDILIPEELIRHYPILCNVNVFSLIKKMETHRRVLIFKFRDVKNEIRYILYKWKNQNDDDVVSGEQEKEKGRLFFLYDVKEKIKAELLECSNIYQYVDEMFSKDIKLGGDNLSFLSLYCKSARKIKKEDIHPILQNYFKFIFEDA